LRPTLRLHEIGRTPGHVTIDIDRSVFGSGSKGV